MNRSNAMWIGMVVCAMAVSPAFGIALGQVDDFQDGTTMNWQEGGPSPNPPFNLANGGPGGVGDHALRNISSGAGNPGSKMVNRNLIQWTGDYTAAGVDTIGTLMRADPGGSSLHMRVAINGGADTWYATTNAFVLPNDGAWYNAAFALTAADLTLVQGADPLGLVLSGVAELRILHSTAPSFRAGSIPATLDLDNITALQSVIPAPAAGLMGVTMLGVIGTRRRRRDH